MMIKNGGRMRSMYLNAITLFVLITIAGSQAQEWQSLFEGKSLKGWRAGGEAKSFKVEDGAIVRNGTVGHLY